MIYCLIICVAAVVLDQLTKLWITSTMELGRSITVIDGVFNLTYVENRGAAFGMLSEHRWVFLVVSVIAICAIFFYLWKEKPESRIMKTCLAMVLGGGIGNMLDRVGRGSVVDFLDCEFVRYPAFSFEGGFSVSLLPFPVFNVADCFITVGCVALIVYLLFVELPRETKNDKNSAGAENASANAENDGKTNE